MASGIIEAIEQIYNPANDRVFLETLNLSESPSINRIHNDIEQLLLLPRQSLPSDCLPTHQIHWGHDISVQSLLRSQPAPPPTVPTLIRSGLDGHPAGFTETNSTKAATGFTSTSLDRTPGPSSNFVRGKSGYMPFRPGGLEDILVNDLDQKTPLMNKSLRTIPPGFLRGLRLPTDPIENDATFSFEADGSYVLEEQSVNENVLVPLDEIHNINSKDIDNLLPASHANLKFAAVRHRKRPANQKREWAHVVDIESPLNDFHKVVPEMAHKYPFDLDAFQKQAIFYLESGNSVFVAAHTSAGKTVVAEYAIALAAKHMTRAIYTSPIKALSNQKFRDFKRTFSSSAVGILTGDVQINPEASCLIMTTEILRSMLYKGADLIRDVEFVIFDEVHYVNDAERGVVWEEVIIMLPDHVNIILLSATVSNTKEFAGWVGRTKKKDIYVISTLKRPVPLEYYLYSGRDTYKIVNADKTFLPGGYEDARGALRRKQDKEREAAGLPPAQRSGGRGAVQRGQRGGTGARGRGATPLHRGGISSRTIHTATDKHLYVHLLGHLRKQGLLPVIVFTLSKKRCEENAATLTNQDLSTSSEKSEIHVTIENALSRLKGSDKNLPQIFKMRDLLSRGIGIHHGGLLPLVKELVEILFARGLVKVLFATETFAMGVNMPARCVVFSNTRKHDGRNFREILPGEFTQMAGRAGRRGLDPTGTVIIVANDPLPEVGVLRNMIIGTPGKLSSQFRLTYNMILNLLRVEALKVEEMIKRSFSENASQRRLPEQQNEVDENEKKLSSLSELDCSICGTDIKAYYDQFSAIKEINQKMLEFAVESRQGSSILSRGRVVILRHEELLANTVGVLLGRTDDQISDISGVATRTKAYDVISWETIDGHPEAVPPKWPITPSSSVTESGKCKRRVHLSSIVLVTPRTVKLDRQLESDLKPIVSEWTTLGRVPEIDWTRIRLLEFQDLLRDRAILIENVEHCICPTCPKFSKHYSLVHGQKVLQAHIESLKHSISDQNLDLIPDYEQRIEVLQDLRFIDKNCTVLLKGRVACEINSANELILTELILENTLATYEPEEVVALLSCFVFQEKTDVEPTLSPKLDTGRQAILDIAERVSGIQDRHNVGDSRSNLKFGLVEVVYEWSKGMPFEQITNLTDVAEGTIVRVITRLDETCREVRDAARVIGDAELFRKMEECQFKIKRDIVFAASLYF